MKDVYKRYRTGEIVTAASDGINFTIEKGEFAIIVGPSGAGKTTVLNILGGMDTADEGQVLVDGSDIVKYTPRQLVTYRRHDIGFVFQFYNLVQNLTALENVELAAQICEDPIPAADALEAAQVDGASAWQTFRYITLPLLKPMTLFVVITSIISYIQAYVQILIMTEGGPGTATYLASYIIYDEAFVKYNFGYASALSFVLFVITAVFTWLSFRVSGTEE